MKKYILVFILLALISFWANASQDAYLKAMQKSITQLWQGSSVLELQNAANSFSRLADLNPDEWLPPYYEALAYAQMGYRSDESLKIKDSYFSLAKASIEKASALSPNNSEIVAMMGFITMGELSLDPGARGQNLSPLAMQTLGKAIALDPQNPRALVMMAQMEWGTAQFFSQSPEKACAWLIKSLEAFAQEASRTDNNSIEPLWGAVMAEQMKGQCP
jgi:tetratricopeptide (TPR) repeat protein